MSDDCKQEHRISELDKEIAVMEERTKAIKEHVSDIADSVKLMQKLILGFIISCSLIVTGSILKDNFTGHAIANTTKEIVRNGK